MRPRDVGAGLTAAAAALLTMIGVAAAGLVLLDAGRAGDLAALTAAAVTLAAGAPATLDVTAPGDVPFSLQASVDAMPLGVTVAGAVVLGVLLLRRGRDGLGVRGATATVAMAAGLLAVAHLASGAVTIPRPDDAPIATAETLDARFSVAGGPAAVAGATGALVVVAVCWLMPRFRGPARRPRVVRWGSIAAIVVAGLLAAWMSGGAAAAGGALLVLPLALAGALPIGLGVPFTVRAEGVLSCVLDGAEPIVPTGALMGVSGAELLAVGVLATARADGRSAVTIVVRMGVIVGAALATLALLSRVDVELGAFGGSVPLLDARLGADPLLALGSGLVAGAVAGLAGIWLTAGVRALTSLPWRSWKDRARR